MNTVLIYYAHTHVSNLTAEYIGRVYLSEYISSVSCVLFIIFPKCVLCFLMEPMALHASGPNEGSVFCVLRFQF